jgi:anti-sigma-K factor RskA
LHRRVEGALADAERGSSGKLLLTQVWSLLSWRWALPAVAAVALVIAAFWVNGRRTESPAPLAVGIAAKPELKPDLDPSFSNYEMAAHQSLDKLDELLTEQVNRNPESSAIYPTASLARLNTSE